jgi:SHS2 domain-containing protein
MTARLLPRRCRSRDEVEANALSGNDWGAEAQPKITEFETEAAAKAMTRAEFEKMV